MTSAKAMTTDGTQYSVMGSNITEQSKGQSLDVGAA